MHKCCKQYIQVSQNINNLSSLPICWRTYFALITTNSIDILNRLSYICIIQFEFFHNQFLTTMTTVGSIPVKSIPLRFYLGSPYCLRSETRRPKFSPSPVPVRVRAPVRDPIQVPVRSPNLRPQVYAHCQMSPPQVRTFSSTKPPSDILAATRLQSRL